MRVVYTCLALGYIAGQTNVVDECDLRPIHSKDERQKTIDADVTCNVFYDNNSNTWLIFFLFFFISSALNTALYMQYTKQKGVGG